MGFWPVVEDMMDNAEIIVLVADARMPDLSLNKELLRKIETKKKEKIVIFNKIDLVSETFLKGLKSKYKSALFVSGKKNKNIKMLRERLQIISKRLKKEDKDLERIRIGFVGYPNIGKSAVINALAHRAKAKVENRPGTTRGVQWIKIGGGLEVMDSPGVIPYEDKNLQLALLGSKSAERMKDPIRVAIEIIKTILDNNPHSLEEKYDVELFDEDEYAIFEKIGKKKGHLIKGGEVDENRTAMMVIRDWQKGSLGIN